ncbi:MAG: hypothetical protein PVI97_19165 [Candidatus Thiodiazotropha sp.]|jgi:hypothetical protein
MIKRKLLRIVLLLYIFFALVLAGCGGGDSDNPSSVNDTENTTDTNDPETTLDSNDPVDQNGNDITANIWMTSDCMQDNTGTYFKSLYQFTSDSQVLQGWQDFQDSSCITRADANLLPINDSGAYQNMGSQALPDGTQGYGLSYTHDGNSYDGFYALTDDNSLCFSTNISFRTDGRHINPDDTSPSVDYDHCLTIHSSTNPNPDQNPNPTPTPIPTQGPDTGSVGLQGKWLLWNVCMPLAAGGSALLVYQFTDDNRFLYAVAGFDNDTCQGDGTTSDYFEAEPPITYSYQGEATMPDGTQGHSIQLTDGSETYNGYFVIDSQERLCVSYNLEITVESAESTDIDYEHCMVRVD